MCALVVPRAVFVLCAFVVPSILKHQGVPSGTYAYTGLIRTYIRIGGAYQRGCWTGGTGGHFFVLFFLLSTLLTYPCGAFWMIFFRELDHYMGEVKDRWLVGNFYHNIYISPRRKQREGEETSEKEET